MKDVPCADDVYKPVSSIFSFRHYSNHPPRKSRTKIANKRKLKDYRVVQYSTLFEGFIKENLYMERLVT